MSIDEAQERYLKRLAKRHRQQRIGIKITISDETRKNRLLETVGDNYARSMHSDMKLRMWRKLNKKT